MAIYVRIFDLDLFSVLGSSATNALKGIEPDSSDSSDNESKDPYKLKDELNAVGKCLLALFACHASHEVFKKIWN